MMADVMCRYRRMAGDRVWFLTGTDEHGDKMAQAAAKEGISPQALVDRVAMLYKEEWRRLGITNDDFIRTTEPRHKKVVQQILQRLWDKGEIYLGEYSGPYCFGCERFYTEKEIVDGKCPDHQTPLTFIKEDNYLFRMSKYQARLIKHLEDHPDFIQPERYRNEVLGFLREPLQDLSISRPRARLDWGIPLPFDDKHVTYVWFDALINYVSALGYPDDEKYTTFWPRAIHLIGKDIVKAHGVYWPTMLWAADIPLYSGLRVHGYWSVEGRKMSKSLGNVVGAWTLAEKYGREVIRYFVLREMHFGLDADFTEEAVVGRLNADLANDLGNLVSRATTVLVNFAGGAVPAAGAEGRRGGGSARGLGAHRRRGGEGDGRVRLLSSDDRHLGVHRRREPLRRRPGAVDPRQGSRQGGAPPHGAVDAWRVAARDRRAPRSLPPGGGGQDPRRDRRARATPGGRGLGRARGGHPRAEALRALPPRGHQDPALTPPQGDTLSPQGRGRRGPRGRSPSPTSRRWTCASPRCSLPRRWSSPRSS